MRLTARALLRNTRSQSFLLIKHLDKASASGLMFPDGFWALPGGGLKAGETFEQALARELFEETGIADVRIGPCLMTRTVPLDLTGTRRVHYERYYLAETTTEELAPAALSANEKKSLVDMRWWTPTEIAQSIEVIRPPILTRQLELILQGGPLPWDITDVTDLWEIPGQPPL